MELSNMNDAPERACRPFDRDHCGMVLSEGSCVLVIETAERAAQRGVAPYAEVLGFASSCDGQGLFDLDETAEVAARTVFRVLRRAGVVQTEIDYVCSHANSSRAFDRKETLVLKKAFGEWAPRLAISSIKGVLGHPFGASGAFQVAASGLAIRHGLIPPTHNLETPAPECDLDYVAGKARAAIVRNALVTSYGYGGVNAYLVLAAPPG